MGDGTANLAECLTLDDEVWESLLADLAEDVLEAWLDPEED